MTAAPGLEVVRVHPDDPLAAPLFTELAAEYGARYGDLFGGAGQEMARYPATDFLPPDGELLLLVEDGVPVAGGAYRRHERAGTAEVKRLWTTASHRRRGLARRVLAELQARAAAAGYASMHLTTGPRQPEAVGLYLAAGWTPLFDPAVPRPTDADALRRLPEDQRSYAFTTTLGDPS